MPAGLLLHTLGLTLSLAFAAGLPAPAQQPDRPPSPTSTPQPDGTRLVRDPARPRVVSIEMPAVGRTWWYHVYVPRAADDARALPLVVLLHGMAGSGRGFMEETGWPRMAEAGAFLVAAPDGLARRPGLEANVVFNPSQWDSGQPGRNRLRGQVDDLGFFDALDADIRRRWIVDPRRVYLVGHSNGASMAFRLAAARADRYAAIAAVAGHCWIDDPQPSRPVPTLWIVGTQDPLRPINGGLSVLPWEVRRTPPLSETLLRWGRANGFDPNTPAVDRQNPGVTVRRYGPDPVAPLLELVMIPGHGHAWPGHPESVPPGGRAFFGPNTAPIDATDWSWRFLRTRSLDAR